MTATSASAYKSLLHEMTQTTPTCLWNDSASISELKYSLDNGAVGATCNPVIVVGVLKKEFDTWKGRIQSLAKEFPTATEDDIAWQVVREMSANAAALLKPIFDKQTGALLWQTDLPFAGTATPIIYMIDGRQYIVIATSGVVEKASLPKLSSILPLFSS